VWSAAHPDTGRPIEGVRLPHWEAVRARVLDLATFDFLAYVGWVVLITDAGPCLIEGNTANVGVGSLQVHGPLLGDARVRRFFEFHNVIGPDRAPLSVSAPV